MERARWQRLVVEGTESSLHTRTLACFNANVDVVAHLEPDTLQPMFSAVVEQYGPVPPGEPDTVRVRSIQEFFALLKDSLSLGKSTYAVLEDLSVLTWFDKYFVEAKRAIGGQAGIIGNQMAALGADSTVYTPNFGPAQASLLHHEVRVPTVTNNKVNLVSPEEAASEDAVVKVNWIFEYAAGLDFVFGEETVRTPRANRVIVATRPPGLEMSFCGELTDCLPTLAEQVDVAFMAGYHYASSDEFEPYLNKVITQLDSLRRGNPELRMHYEYVPTKHVEIESQLLSAICSRVDSFGINEHEMIRALELLGFPEERQAIEADESAYTLYRGALALQKHLGVRRIHVHNLGYYVLLLQKPYVTSPHVVRDAALYGSTVNAGKAKYGGVVSIEEVQSMSEWPLSDIGYSQLESFASHDRVQQELRAVDSGIWEADDHWVLVIPAHVFPDPVSTVGMGDTISSSSFAREVELAAMVTPHKT